MMVATSNPNIAAAESTMIDPSSTDAPKENSTDGTTIGLSADVAKENSTAADENEVVPAMKPDVSLPRKTWALPKAPPPTSSDDPTTTSSSSGEKKKSLLEIMEEEKRLEQETILAKQKELEQRLAQEEEAALMQALQASISAADGASTSVGCGNSDDGMDEDLKLALMLSLQDQQLERKLPPSEKIAALATAFIPPAAASVPPAAAAAASVPSDHVSLTEEELAEIEKALQEADAAQSAKTDAASFKLALELQSEEDGKIKAQNWGPQQQGNVRTMHRDDFLREKGNADYNDNNYYQDDDDDDYDYDDMDNNGTTEAGFRINSTKPSPWSRTDRATIKGPNQELRTKHDLKLQAQTNAYRLELRADDETGERAHVGNKAYNAFHRSMQKKTVKGVAAHGTGRATADVDKTREGALDGRVRLQIARAVNNGLIQTFHGCVKEGKEALVFHADKGSNSEGFDVAVKVFKRIQEFKNRGEYVGGDPRYGDGQDFRHAAQRQQIELWAEKEHRNLIRAYRAKVPVPRPLWLKENVLFLRFLGEEGWPSPQLRELDIKKGSKKWTALYEQTMVAMQRLYCDARLVHGDLSEYNILVCPGIFLRRVDEEVGNEIWKVAGDEGEKKAPGDPDASDKQAQASEDAKPTPKTDPIDVVEPKAADATTAMNGTAHDDDSLQIVLIDFGQAVDFRHPEAEELLRRDTLRVKQFYDKVGITTISVEAAMAYVQTKDAPLR